jgi:cell division protein FtsQ
MTATRSSNVREQVVSQKVGNRSGIAGKGRSTNVSQRPVRRDRESGLSVAARLRNLLGYIPVALKIGLLLTMLALVFLGYRAAASASFFQVRNIEMRGLSRASSESIRAAIRHDVEKTGVWRADLAGLSAHLEQLPWVRKAIVTRVLPDGIRVRITEREPRAVVRTNAGRFVWVDEDAVVLSEMLPVDQMPNFFLRGWNEDESELSKTENKERVKKFLELQHDWDLLSLSERVSEVNLLDTRDIRAQLAGDDSQIEVRLGAEDHGQRLKKALSVLDSQRQTSRGPLISYIDLTQGKRAIVGLSSGTHVTDGVEQGDDAASADERTKTSATDKNAKEAKAKKKPEQKRT